MRLAVNLPNFGELADPTLVVELAVTAEDAGWDGLFMWDHIVVGDGMPVADPWVLLAAVAQATKRIALGPMVTPVPRRRPWVLSRQATTLDHLSGGRLILGVGLGFPPDEEFGTFGEPTDDGVRAELLDEGLEIMRGMWSGEPFTFHGVHNQVRRTTFAPTPAQQHLPLWVAGMWPNRRPFRRAARHDGVFPIAADMHMLPPDEVAEIVAYVDRWRPAQGPFDVVISGPRVTPAEVSAYQKAGVTWYLVGPAPEGETAAEIRSWVSGGPPH